VAGHYICHLLSHTSGIPDERYFQRIDRRRDYSEQELLREIAALPRYVDKTLTVIVLANRARWEPADTHPRGSGIL
jgi:CubicO group peptidase (beta-lactamase class C family)